MSNHLCDHGYPLTSDILLKAYCCGIFPMAENETSDNIFWVEPEKRGVIPLNHVHIPKSLKKIIRRDVFDVRVDQDFDAVIKACATPVKGRTSSWINPTIIELYSALYRKGHCHSVEVFYQNERVGGLYGVSIGAAFFGESMFSWMNDASKVALIHLIARLKRGGYQLLDTQFTTDHLKRFGAIDISKESYRIALRDALAQDADFYVWPKTGIQGAESLQAVSQTS